MRLSRKQNRDNLPFLFLGVIQPDDNHQGANDSEIHRKASRALLSTTSFPESAEFAQLSIENFLSAVCWQTEPSNRWIEHANPIPGMYLKSCR